MDWKIRTLVWFVKPYDSFKVSTMRACLKKLEISHDRNIGREDGLRPVA